jgi:chemotaxis response regulator CheB
MKKIVLLLLINLLIPISSISQTISKDSTVTITATQLKQINLIFNEHDALKKEKAVYLEQIASYERVIDNYQQLDSVNTVKSKLYKQELQNKEKTISDLNKNLKLSKTKHKIKNWIIGILGGVSGLLLLK